MPYAVLGRMAVSSGASCFGVEGPKTAMEEGQKTRSELSRASSSTLAVPALFTCGGFEGGGESYRLL
eukprot:5798135-Pleurochrysis_carterae.AAC.1